MAGPSMHADPRLRHLCSCMPRQGIYSGVLLPAACLATLTAEVEGGGGGRAWITHDYKGACQKHQGGHLFGEACSSAAGAWH